MPPKNAKLNKEDDALPANRGHLDGATGATQEITLDRVQVIPGCSGSQARPDPLDGGGPQRAYLLARNLL